MNVLILDQILEENFQSLYCDVNHEHLIYVLHLPSLPIAFQVFFITSFNFC